MFAGLFGLKHTGMDSPTSKAFSGSAFVTFGAQTLSKSHVRPASFTTADGAQDPAKFQNFLVGEPGAREAEAERLMKNRQTYLKKFGVPEPSRFLSGYVFKSLMYNHGLKIEVQREFATALKKAFRGGDLKHARKLEIAMRSCVDNLRKATEDPVQRKNLASSRAEMTIFLSVSANFHDSVREFAEARGMTINFVNGRIERGGVWLILLVMAAEALQQVAESGAGPAAMVDVGVVNEAGSGIHEAALAGGLYTGDDKQMAPLGALSAAAACSSEMGWTPLSVDWFQRLDKFSNFDPLSGKICFEENPKGRVILGVLPKPTALELTQLADSLDKYCADNHLPQNEADLATALSPKSSIKICEYLMRSSIASPARLTLTYRPRQCTLVNIYSRRSQHKKRCGVPRKT